MKDCAAWIPSLLIFSSVHYEASCWSQRELLESLLVLGRGRRWVNLKAWENGSCCGDRERQEQWKQMRTGSVAAQCAVGAELTLPGDHIYLGLLTSLEWDSAAETEALSVDLGVSDNCQAPVRAWGGFGSPVLIQSSIWRQWEWAEVRRHEACLGIGRQNNLSHHWNEVLGWSSVLFFMRIHEQKLVASSSDLHSVWGGAAGDGWCPAKASVCQSTLSRVWARSWVTSTQHSSSSISWTGKYLNSCRTSVARNWESSLSGKWTDLWKGVTALASTLMTEKYDSSVVAFDLR